MISVIVPTFDRPDGLMRAVTCLYRQTLATDGFDLIIVDNTPSATASEVIAELRRACPKQINLIVLHEPAAGVANARNHAMSAAKTDLIAFLDDDQSAPEAWLETLIAAHRKHPAAVTFGPVRTALPKEQSRHRAYFESFFARDPGYKTGYIPVTFGCGNALIDFSKVHGGPPWFDTDMNESGGEDDVLFERIRHAGGSFAWAADARVWEHPPADRVTLRYTLKRAFSYGQAPITLARRHGSNALAITALWMMVGLGKAAFHGLIWLALSLVRHPGRAFELDKAIRGIGKLFWWVDLRFYGAAVLNRQPTIAPSQMAPEFSKEAEQA
ncbi:MAG: glycosyltransferase family 2 protein [Pseudomonadota bacterium]